MRRMIGLAVIFLALALAAYAMMRISFWLDHDSCLDLGGSVNMNSESCDMPEGRQYVSVLLRKKAYPIWIVLAAISWAIAACTFFIVGARWKRETKNAEKTKGAEEQTKGTE